MIDKKFYEEALLAQSACNLSGVVYSYAKAMDAVCEEARALGKGTDWRNNHPICRLYAEQIMHLTSSKSWDEAYAEAKAAGREGG